MNTQKSAKKTAVILCIVLALVAAAGIGGYLYFDNTYISIHDTIYPRASAELDLSGVSQPDLDVVQELENLQLLNLRDTGISAEEYDTLRAAMPACEILWSVPFQGGYLPDDTAEITVESLSDGDVAQLAYLTQLQTVRAGDCRDYEQVFAMMAQYPNLQVSYTVPVNGRIWPMDTREMTLTDADAQELAAMLPYLPEMENIRLEGILPDAEALRALTAEYADIDFYWQIELFGLRADVYTTELDFSGIPMESVDQVEQGIGYLPALETVFMSHCGISNEEMDALNRRHQDVRFIWTVQIGFTEVRTDATTFIYIHPYLTLTDKDCYNLRYCTDMICLDLGHHPLSNCDFVAFMPNLQFLIIIDNTISDITPLANHEHLVYLELFMTDVTDYSPLLTCTALEDLNICFTYGDIDPICQMTWLKNLWWSPGDSWKYSILSQALPNTYLELQTKGSTANGWRRLENYYAQRDLFGMAYFD